MNEIYIAILGILLLLAVFDLVVGVSNDAANFLNSAVGCNAARRSMVLGVAAVGIVLGASLSGGMMEIARSGVFVPSQFSFHGVMILFLAVMLTDVILLDLFNTFGLPTSTTVSLVFELLGAAVAVALFTICEGGENVAQNLGAYINSYKSLTIISGIFCSVAVAFTCGCVVMWFSRLLFSFRYQRAYKYIGALWCAASLTAISYFAVFKGLKHSSVVTPEMLAWLNSNICYVVLGTLGVWFVISFILQYLLHVNTLRFTVLAGTCALALAFAGNDLVNFIGVFMAAESSYHIASAHVAAGGTLDTLRMGSLSAPVQANIWYLLAAGGVMVLALIFSKKARTVTETEVKLARSNGVSKERFGSCLPARAAVRWTLNVSRFITRITPAPIARFVSKRFEALELSEDDGTAFDMVRASVNLTISALLISLATSLKLPLSTTYVTFMVAMGSSLADRAWGRDSAVYRITGVMVVIGGWFTTGLLAFLAAGITASVMMFGGMWGIVLMLLVAGCILVKSAYIHRRKNADTLPELDLNSAETMRELGENSADRLGCAYGIYRAAVKALLEEDYSALKRLRKKARELNRTLQAIKEDQILPCLQTLPARLYDKGQLALRLHENSINVSECLLTIVKNCYKHIANNHVGLTLEQGRDLLSMSNRISACFPGLSIKLQSEGGSGIEEMMAQSGDLKSEFAQCIRAHLIRAEEDEMDMRNGILYLNLLNETRAMVRHSFLLLQDQSELFRLHT
ncbi:MAG: inorganic phosphate transporter [Akkermansia sp.]|nr:inorganic phosphate transporter [Akkermansia sp.]